MPFLFVPFWRLGLDLLGGGIWVWARPGALRFLWAGGPAPGGGRWGRRGLGPRDLALVPFACQVLMGGVDQGS